MEKNLYALILCNSKIASIKIAALTVLDRLVICLHRAGCKSITIVSNDQLPDLQRANALGIPTHCTSDRPFIHQPTIFATANILVQPVDVLRMIQYRGRLVNQHGEALPIGLVSQASVSIEEALQDLTRVSAKGVAELINDQRSARRAERHLWSSLTSKTDGFVDRTVNRPLGRFLSKILIHAPLTPNQISVISMMIGLWAAYCFNLGNYAAGIIGALLLQVSAIIDCVDGDIARILHKESRLGKWLDISADQVVHVALFAAIAIGLKRQGSSAPVLLLGISAVIGALLSFGVVVRGMVVPKNRQNAKLQKLIDSTTNRDFSVLLLLLALFNQLDWFLWLAAIGVHIFWLTALILQLAETRHQPFESE